MLWLPQWNFNRTIRRKCYSRIMPRFYLGLIHHISRRWQQFSKQPQTTSEPCSVVPRKSQLCAWLRQRQLPVIVRYPATRSLVALQHHRNMGTGGARIHDASEIFQMDPTGQNCDNRNFILPKIRFSHLPLGDQPILILSPLGVFIR